MNPNAVWYANALPRSEHRSKDAYIRERLKQRTTHIDKAIEDAMLESSIETLTLVAGDIGDDKEGTMRELSRCVGEYVTEAILDEAHKETGLTDIEEIERARKTWTPQANACAREWLEEQAPASHWDTLIRSIRSVQPEKSDGELTMTRLVDLARVGPKLAQKMKQCERWVAREAYWNIPTDTLENNEEKWKRHAVQMHARTLDWNNDVNDEDAERAIEHWRWPTMRPPLSIIAAGAGRLAPIQTDSAWANALRTMTRLAVCDPHLPWIDERRKDEEQAIRQAISKVGEITRRSVDPNDREKASGIIARCRRAWGGSVDLKGDGYIGTPKLRPVNDGDDIQMMWVFKITGPEVLLAGCELEGVTTRVAQQDNKVTKTLLSQTRLAITVERTMHYGRFIEVNTPTRSGQRTLKSALGKIKHWTANGGGR